MLVIVCIYLHHGKPEKPKVPLVSFIKPKDIHTKYATVIHFTIDKYLKPECFDGECMTMIRSESEREYIIKEQLGLKLYQNLYLDNFRECLLERTSITPASINMVITYMRNHVLAEDILSFRNIHFVDRDMYSIIHIINDDAKYDYKVYAIHANINLLELKLIFEDTY
jgi:hypothetical protein